MAVILDSDLQSILQRRSEPECTRLENRLSQLAGEEVFTSIVTFQEQMRGRLAVLHKARTDQRLLMAYTEPQLMLRDFCHLNILPFDADSLSQFKKLRRQKICIGTMDLRIASVALATQSTLLSRNLRDFQKVPGFRSKTGLGKYFAASGRTAALEKGRRSVWRDQCEDDHGGR